MEEYAAGLRPLEGGFSGETFLAEAGDERSVVRIYAGRSAARGPLAAEVDAALLQLVAPVLPVPRVLEARRGDPERDLPGLLVCSWMPGTPLDAVLDDLDEAGLATAGRELGALLGRLGLVLQPQEGFFADHRLRPDRGLPPLSDWVEEHRDTLPADCREGLDALVEEAEDLLAEDARRVLVHGDLNPKNVLVDPGSGTVTALLDWEFAHAGHPWTDLGNLLRHAPPGERGEVLAGAVLTSYAALVPGVPRDVRDRAAAADLASLVELASRREPTPPVRLARTRLRAELARVGLGWTSPVEGA